MLGSQPSPLTDPYLTPSDGVCLLDGETYDEDAMEDVFFDDIGNREAEDREPIDFSEWLT